MAYHKGSVKLYLQIVMSRFNLKTLILNASFFGLSLPGCGGNDVTLEVPAPEPQRLEYQGLLTPATLTQTNKPIYQALALNPLDELYAPKIRISNTQSQSELSFLTSELESRTGSCDGEVSITGSLNSDLQGDLTFEFIDYDDCTGTVYNGNLAIEIAQYNREAQSIHSGTIQYNELRVVDNLNDWLVNGSSEITQSDDQIKTVSSNQIDILDQQNVLFYRLENFVTRTGFSDPQQSTQIGYGATGDIYVSLYGMVQAETNPQLVCTTERQRVCPYDTNHEGVISLNPSSENRLEITYLQHSQKEHKSISREDFFIEGEQFVELVPGENPFIRTNLAPFAYAGSDVVDLFDNRQSATFSAAASFDPEGNYLSYQWDPVSVSGCGINNGNRGNISDISYSGTDTATLQVTATVPGDYCFKITVTDTRNSVEGSNSDFVVLSLRDTNALSAEQIFTFEDSPFYDAQALELIDLGADGSKELLIFSPDLEALEDLPGHVYKENDFGEVQFSQTVDTRVRFDTYPRHQNTAVADVNQDGLEDLVAITRYDESLRRNFVGSDDAFINLYLQNEAGTLQEKRTLGQITTAIEDAQIGVRDVNSDGQNDVLVLTNHAIYVYLLSNGKLVSESVLEPEALEIRDIEEIISIVPTPDWDELFVLYSANSQVQFTSIKITESGQFSGADSLVATLSIEQNDETKLFHIANENSIQKLGVTSTARSLLVFDVAEGLFLLRQNVLFNNSINDYEFIDANGDGTTDLIAMEPSKSLLLLQNDAGLFEETSFLEIPHINPLFGRKLADFNNDGLLDVVAAAGDKIKIYSSLKE